MEKHRTFVVPFIDTTSLTFVDGYIPFPAPPALEGASTLVSNVVNVAKLVVYFQLFAIACNKTRNVGPKTRKAIGIRGKRCSARRNLVHPKSKDNDRRRVTEFRITMTEQRRSYEKDDDDDVVYAIDTSTTVSEETYPRYKTPVHFHKSTKSTAIQTIVGLPLRLRVLPAIKDIVQENETNASNPKGFSKIWKYLRFLGRLALSLFGLFWFLVTWAIVGAIVFCAIEGPREREQVTKLKDMQNDLAVSLATELRQLRTEKDEDLEPLWSSKVQKYVAKHEELLLSAVDSGYGESDGGELWTLPGCVLFALALLTTLGFGAPVPRTTIGRTVTVIFAAIGIPAHFLLIMNVGLLLAVRLQRYAISRKFVNYDPTDPKYLAPIPKWVKIVPFVCGVSYYLLGIVCFGIARSRPIAASILFPLDFTAAGGLSTVVGHVRILYGLYLEGAVTIAAFVVSVLQVSATQNFTNIGLKYGLLIEA